MVEVIGTRRLLLRTGRMLLYTVPLWLCYNGQALASIVCQDSQMPVPGMTCGTTGTGGFTEVTFRKVPSWGGHAGMVLIDMCRIPDPVLQKPFEPGKEYYVETKDGGDNSKVVQSEPGLGCIRRYCTEDINHFSFFLSGVPIPIGPAFSLAISVGFSKTSFEIRCKNIGRDGGEPWEIQ